jgi:hypothetical protein
MRSLNLPLTRPPLPFPTPPSDGPLENQARVSAFAPPRRPPAPLKKRCPSKVIAALDTANVFRCTTCPSPSKDPHVFLGCHLPQSPRITHLHFQPVTGHRQQQRRGQGLTVHLGKSEARGAGATASRPPASNDRTMHFLLSLPPIAGH